MAMLVLQFPARWVTDGVVAASGQRLMLVNVRGTVWDGSGVLVIGEDVHSRDAVSLPGRLAWRLRPGWAQTAADGTGAGSSFALVATLTHECCLRRPLRVTATRDGADTQVHLSALDWQAPAGLLRGLGAPWNTLAFDGTLTLSAQDLRIRVSSPQGMGLQGKLVFTADAISSRISNVDPLGSYRVEVSDGPASGATGGGTRLALSTSDGPLKLSGEGEIVAGQLRARILAQAEPAQADALANVLGLIGNRDGPVTLRTIR